MGFGNWLVGIYAARSAADEGAMQLSSRPAEREQLAMVQEAAASLTMRNNMASQSMCQRHGCEDGKIAKIKKGKMIHKSTYKNKTAVKCRETLQGNLFAKPVKKCSKMFGKMAHKR